MVLQETFGEFDSPERLRSLIQLICQLPGTYEVLIKSEKGEEGILHCENDTVRNAACRNLSGMEAFTAILAWERGKYWLEELPVLPMRTLNLPLDKLFAEVDNISPGIEHLQAPEEKPEDRRPESSEPEPSQTEPSQTEPSQSEPTQSVSSTPRPEPEPRTDTEPEITPVFEEPAPQTKPLVEPGKEPAKPEPVTTVPDPGAVEEKTAELGLAAKIAALQGVKGVIISSQDGILLARYNIDPAEEQVQMVALFSEALEQIGDLFGKGKLIHGAIDMAAQRILVHTFRRSFVGSFIAPNVSAAMVGEQIEQLISGVE